MDYGNSMGPAVIHRGNSIEYAPNAFCDLVGVNGPTAATGRSLDQFAATSDWDHPDEQLLRPEE